VNVALSTLPRLGHNAVGLMSILRAQLAVSLQYLSRFMVEWYR